jgi:hypothetical protein
LCPPLQCSQKVLQEQNIETFEDLIGILNKSNDIVAIEVTPEDFHEWVTMFKELYIDFPAVLKYHLFESENIEDVSMQVGRDLCETTRNSPFYHPNSSRSQGDSNGQAVYQLMCPFLKPINMDKTCPYRGNEMMARIKDNKRVERVSKKRKPVVLAAPSEVTDGL